jgi:hypothetical protein
VAIVWVSTNGLAALRDPAFGAIMVLLLIAGAFNLLSRDFSIKLLGATHLLRTQGWTPPTAPHSPDSSDDENAGR